MKTIIYISLFFILFSSCKIKYSFSGADIDPNIKSFSVNYFENNSGNGPASMSDLFTNALKEKIMKETNLNLVTNNADIEFNGYIESYYYTVQAPTGTETSDLRRITMKVKINFVNNISENENWEKIFQSHAEHSVNVNLNLIEEESLSEINELLVDEIFTKAFVNW